MSTCETHRLVRWVYFSRVGQHLGRWPNSSIAWLAPVLVSAVLSLSFLETRGSLDGHEVLVAQTAREMVRSGDWICPTFSGEPRFQKPPLAYWMASLSYLITGSDSVWSARLPSALVTVLGVGLLCWYAARRIGQPVGVLVGLIHATSVWTIGFGKSALVDSTLTVLVAAAVLISSFDRLELKVRWSYFVVAFWTCCGLVVLAKGPVGLVIVWPTVLIYRFARTRLPTDRPLLFHRAAIAGICLFILTSVAWPLAVLRQHPEVAALWMDQSVGRFVQHWKNEPPPWYYYLYYTPLLTLPWAPMWLLEGAAAIRRRLSGRRLDDLQLLSWIWLAVAVVFLSFSAGKRSHYILPALPACSLLATYGLGRWALWWRPLAIRHSWTLLTVGLMAVVATVMALPWFDLPDLQSLYVPVLIGGLLLFVGYSAAIVWTARPNSVTSPSVFWCSVITLILLYEGAICPRFEGRPARSALVSRNRQLIDDADLVIQVGSNDHSTIFDVDRPMAWLDIDEELTQTLTHTQSTLLLVPHEDLAALQDALPVEVVDRCEPPFSLGERKAERQLLLVRPLPRHWANHPESKERR